MPPPRRRRSRHERRRSTVAHRRALISQTRPPEVDRDSGSQQIDLYIRWLLDAGWSVTFMSSDTDGDEHHAHRLRQMGVPVFIGYDQAEDVITAGGFDVAVLAFWEPASRLLPILRRASPQTRVIVDSVDLHFLRDARRTLGSGRSRSTSRTEPG